LRVFCDLKLHDIPTTVGRAARVLGRLGVSYLNFHAAGGVEMLRAGVEGVREGAQEAGRAAPYRSRSPCSPAIRRVGVRHSTRAHAIESGCGGVVCSVQEIERVKRARQDFVTVVPGVRLADGETHDQARVGTPTQVAAAGADILVIGRAVSAATDRAANARLVHEAVSDALAGAH